jgi:hypothetical protein
MAQTLLPIVPAGATSITPEFNVVVRDDVWAYCVGAFPVFAHRAEDHAGFRLYTSLAIAQGLCGQGDIVRAFGVSASSVKRGVKRFRQGGAKAFYAPRRGRGPAVLTEAVRARAQGLLDGGHTRSEVASTLGIGQDCVRKAIAAGRLHEPSRAAAPPAEPAAWDKSARGVEDARAALGMGCTRPLERVLAATGQLDQAPTRFEPCRDVPLGGVLTALPALLANGLLRHLDTCFTKLSGYYGTVQVVLVLAFMALGRIQRIEQLRYEPPGEWGKLLGLDRIPEVRTLRAKVKALCQDPALESWPALLAADWMREAPEVAGVLYVDGHVRVYHGHKTKLPARYVARDRLCLRGVTDYYVNDIAGRPFFVVERQVDAGLLEALRTDIVPRLLKDVPLQPTAEQLEDDPFLSRFVLVFDREGYSPGFFKTLWHEHRIACLTYHKYPGEKWRDEEFRPYLVSLSGGEAVEMDLAERGTRLGSGQDRVWVREFRKRTQTGHQVSLITTAYGADGTLTATRLFSRWTQENFFKYMSQEYGIEALVEYGTEEFPDPPRVVNPAWRTLDAKARALQARLRRAQAEFAANEMHPQTEPPKEQAALDRGAQLLETVEQLERELAQCKSERKQTDRHVALDTLPPEQRFPRLLPRCKRFTDTIKLLAYRAETAMALLLREHLDRSADARPLIRDLLSAHADLVPDEARGTLTVRIHPLTTPRATRAIADLLAPLNETETRYPGTELRLHYEMTATPHGDTQPGSHYFPPDQEV